MAGRAERPLRREGAGAVLRGHQTRSKSQLRTAPGALCSCAATAESPGPTDTFDHTALKIDRTTASSGGVVQTDVGEHGLSVGDGFIYADKLFQDRKQVGQDGSSCQVTGLDGAKTTTNCVLSVQLPDGQLTAQSLWTNDSDTVRIAVTGGTGVRLPRGHRRADLQRHSDPSRDLPHRAGQGRRRRSDRSAAGAIRRR